MPRMYQKKVGAHAVDNRIRQKTENRDAVVWSIDAANDIVNLKIQGSDTLLVAHYHQVLNAVPRYLKPGAAVTVRHRRGNRGYVEVSGTGRSIPTPVAGSSGLPEVNLVDTVLSGMVVEQIDPLDMKVKISAGVYRLDNTLYTWSETNNFYYVMDDPAPILMGSNPVYMGAQYYVVDIPAAPSTPQYGRYDILVVGPHDAQIDVVSGSEVNLSTTAPTMPSTPADHVLVDFIFVQYGDTVVTDEMIGQSYSEPAPEEVTVTLSGTWVNVDQELTWNAAAPPQPQCDISISCTDQYGGAYTFNQKGTLTLLTGAGQVYGSYTSWRSDYAESYHTSSVSFKYERNQSAADEYSPVLQYDVPGFSTVFIIVILDASGNPM